MIISFSPGRFDWTAERFPIPFNAPFERITLDELDADTATVGVTIAELTRDFDYPERFYLSIPALIAYIENLKAKEPVPYFDDGNRLQYEDILHFQIWMGDIEMLLQMDISRIYEWGTYR